MAEGSSGLHISISNYRFTSKSISASKSTSKSKSISKFKSVCIYTPRLRNLIVAAIVDSGAQAREEAQEAKRSRAQ